MNVRRIPNQGIGKQIVLSIHKSYFHDFDKRIVEGVAPSSQGHISMISIWIVKEMPPSSQVPYVNGFDEELKGNDPIGTISMILIRTCQATGP